MDSMTLEGDRSAAVAEALNVFALSSILVTTKRAFMVISNHQTPRVSHHSLTKPPVRITSQHIATLIFMLHIPPPLQQPHRTHWVVSFPKTRAWVDLRKRAKQVYETSTSPDDISYTPTWKMLFHPMRMMISLSFRQHILKEGEAHHLDMKIPPMEPQGPPYTRRIVHRTLITAHGHNTRSRHPADKQICILLSPISFTSPTRRSVCRYVCTIARAVVFALVCCPLFSLPVHSITYLYLSCLLARIISACCIKFRLHNLMNESGDKKLRDRRESYEHFAGSLRYYIVVSMMIGCRSLMGNEGKEREEMFGLEHTRYVGGNTRKPKTDKVAESVRVKDTRVDGKVVAERMSVEKHQT